MCVRACVRVRVYENQTMLALHNIVLIKTIFKTHDNLIKNPNEECHLLQASH